MCQYREGSKAAVVYIFGIQSLIQNNPSPGHLTANQKQMHKGSMKNILRHSRPSTAFSVIRDLIWCNWAIKPGGGSITLEMFLYGRTWSSKKYLKWKKSDLTGWTVLYWKLKTCPTAEEYHCRQSWTDWINNNVGDFQNSAVDQCRHSQTPSTVILCCTTDLPAATPSASNTD